MKSRTDMGRIVVIVSADGEWRASTPLFPNAKMNNSPLGEWFTTPVAGEEVIVYHGGWGKEHAAASTEYVIEKWHPDLVINFGTCGGFKGQVNRFDTVLVEKAIVYDFISLIGPPDEGIKKFTTEIDLGWVKKPPTPVKRVHILSGDRDLIPEDIPKLREKFNGMVNDYESAPTAWVCARNSTKVLILRGVSDLVDKSGGEAYDGTATAWFEATKQVMSGLFTILPAWVTYFRTQK
jgi:adenosylhomocysteine nucleosidase